MKKIELIDKLVDRKINQLRRFQQAQWEGGRLYFECEIMRIESSEYKNEDYALFLENLENRINKEGVHIYDWQPSGQVNITKGILEWINNRLIHLELKNTHADISENIHPRIFKTVQGFDIYKDYIENGKNKFTEYCFLYHKMIKENLMHSITPKVYQEWVYENFQIDLSGNWKQFNRCTTDAKEKYYSLVLLRSQSK